MVISNTFLLFVTPCASAGCTYSCSVSQHAHLTKADTPVYNGLTDITQYMLGCLHAFDITHWKTSSFGYHVSAESPFLLFGVVGSAFEHSSMSCNACSPNTSTATKPTSSTGKKLLILQNMSVLALSSIHCIWQYPSSASNHSVQYIDDKMCPILRHIMADPLEKRCLCQPRVEYLTAPLL